MIEQIHRADQIAQELADMSSAALLSGDFDQYIEHIALPCTVLCETQEYFWQAPDDVRHVFRAIRDFLRVNNVTMIVRNLLAAEFKDPNNISATLESRLLSGNRLVQRPHPCLLRITKTPGAGWRVRHATYSLPDDSGYRSALRMDA